MQYCYSECKVTVSTIINTLWRKKTNKCTITMLGVIHPEPAYADDSFIEGKGFFSPPLPYSRGILGVFYIIWFSPNQAMFTALRCFGAI